MFLIIWLFLSSPLLQAQNAQPSAEKLVDISELRLVSPMIETSLKTKLRQIAEKPKYPCNAKCKAAIDRNMHELDQKMPAIKAELKTALAADIKQKFDGKSLSLLLTVYQSNSFQHLQKNLPPLQPDSKRIYQKISQPINLAVITNPAMDKKLSKEEIELLKKVVVHPVFIKFNRYLVSSEWAAVLEETRRTYAENIKNPFE